MTDNPLRKKGSSKATVEPPLTLQEYCDRRNAGAKRAGMDRWHRVITRTNHIGEKVREVDVLEGYQAITARREHEALVEKRRKENEKGKI